MDATKKFIPVTDNRIQWLDRYICHSLGRTDLKDGFYFATPYEDLEGPYGSLAEAQIALNNYKESV